MLRWLGIASFVFAVITMASTAASAQCAATFTGASFPGGTGLGASFNITSQLCVGATHLTVPPATLAGTLDAFTNPVGRDFPVVGLDFVWTLSKDGVLLQKITETNFAPGTSLASFFNFGGPVFATAGFGDYVLGFDGSVELHTFDSICVAEGDNPCASRTQVDEGVQGVNLGVFDIEIDIAAPVPEPNTWAMMILGFVGLGFLVRRRRNHTALTAV